MALAPGADTFFYSFSDLNPYNSINEGFLAYLYYVGNQSYPPLVHSLSYGDVEANVFNASNPGSASYGERCDQEFMKMGLRGLTVVFSSGDDGIGNNIVRDDPDYACSQAFPAWPASSPYVTTVGATQLSDQYLPVCSENYAHSSSFPKNLPSSLQLPFQCTAAKETTCSSTIGGVITSGGGFSNVINRATLAPWQDAAVATYLSDPSNIPPLSYFNASGRAYPDVATYGSNYFVYLNASIVRESGTSASAPVFAAMVTLWNDMRLAYGYSPMGFIAPFLYDISTTHPEAFNDITTGDNVSELLSELMSVYLSYYMIL
jgi:tripeptidyl-peptidase I